MWTRKFWKATTERGVSTAAQAALLVFGADQVNVIHADWPVIAGFAAGGFVLTVLKSLAVGAKDGNPSAVNAETLVPDNGPRHLA